MEEPTFVFAHMLVPHPPFVLDKNGNFCSPQQQAGKTYMEQYFEQLTATNNMIKTLINQLLSMSDEPPIIVIQGDEGPRREDLILTDVSWNIGQASEEELKEKMRVLNAYYLPHVEKDLFN